jgi:hypothetical protein
MTITKYDSSKNKDFIYSSINDLQIDKSQGDAYKVRLNSMGIDCYTPRNGYAIAPVIVENGDELFNRSLFFTLMSGGNQKIKTTTKSIPKTKPKTTMKQVAPEVMYTLDHLKKHFIFDNIKKGGDRLRVKRYNSGIYTSKERVVYIDGASPNTSGKVEIGANTYDIRAVIKCLKDKHHYYPIRSSIITPNLKDITKDGKLVFGIDEIDCVLKVNKVRWSDVEQSEDQMTLELDDTTPVLVDTRFGNNPPVPVPSEPPVTTYKYFVKIFGDDGLSYQVPLTAENTKKTLSFLTELVS